MTLRTLAFSLSLLAPIALHAQAATTTPPAPDERPAVLAAIKSLFDGMRAGDSAKVRAAFHPDAQLSTAVVRNGTPAVEVDSLAKFLRAVGTPHDIVWDERTHDEEVRIDGTLAQVWAPYEFWAGPKFSHCGVDAFMLAKTTAGWRIIALSDTRRRTGCQGNAGTVQPPAKP